MTYAQGRLFYDADSHVMELADWLVDYCDSATRAALRPFGADKVARAEQAAADIAARSANEELRRKAEKGLLAIRGWESLGGSDPAERSRALDLLGFSAQLVFNTVATEQFWYYEQPDLMFGGTRALNRAIVDWCRSDPRLLPAGFLPLADPDRSLTEARAAVELGCRGVVVPSVPPPGLSPSHAAYDPVWRTLSEARVPLLLHVCTGGGLVSAAYRNNGRPAPQDFLGGGENIRSKDFMGMHAPPQMFLTVMVLDGVFDRFPDLRAGCIEQGGLWIPAWLKQLDLAHGVFARTEPDLLSLSMKPSDFVRRQIKFTTFFVEPLDWLISQIGPDLIMFGSDFPHTEGGPDPVGAAEGFLAKQPESIKRKFFSDNFAQLMEINLAQSAGVLPRSQTHPRRRAER